MTTSNLIKRRIAQSPQRKAPRSNKSLRDTFGLCQWFHYEDYQSVVRTIELMTELGVRHLRTGISWADYLREGGQAWYDWQLSQLERSGIEVLLSVWHTPPSLSESDACNGPPRRLRDYADFIDLIITRYGNAFSSLELWNEPNNRYKWDFPKCDPQWKKFGEMIGAAAYWAKQRGHKTVLGGMIPIDAQWLSLMQDYGVLAYIDVVAIHGFPGMWFPHHPNWDWHSHWRGWQDKIDSLASIAGDKPIWITETGLATWDLALNRPDKFDLQSRMLEAAAQAPAARTYWYSLLDLDPARDAIEGFHVDENEYHMGLIDVQGRPKQAYSSLKNLLHPSDGLAGNAGGI
jgi:CDP-paratose 2-epimerase